MARVCAACWRGEVMTDRKYSISEIDAMRKAMDQRLFFQRGERMYGPGDDFREQQTIRRNVEEQLRTYMLAGIEPQDVIDKYHKEYQELFT